MMRKIVRTFYLPLNKEKVLMKNVAGKFSPSFSNIATFILTDKATLLYYKVIVTKRKTGGILIYDAGFSKRFRELLKKDALFHLFYCEKKKLLIILINGEEIYEREKVVYSWLEPLKFVSLFNIAIKSNIIVIHGITKEQVKIVENTIRMKFRKFQRYMSELKRSSDEQRKKRILENFLQEGFILAPPNKTWKEEFTNILSEMRKIFLFSDGKTEFIGVLGGKRSWIILEKSSFFLYMSYLFADSYTSLEIKVNEGYTPQVYLKMNDPNEIAILQKLFSVSRKLRVPIPINIENESLEELYWEDMFAFGTVKTLKENMENKLSFFMFVPMKKYHLYLILYPVENSVIIISAVAFLEYNPLLEAQLTFHLLKQLKDVQVLLKIYERGKIKLREKYL